MTAAPGLGRGFACLHDLVSRLLSEVSLVCMCFDVCVCVCVCVCGPGYYLEEVTAWPEVKLQLGQVSGLALDSDGHLVIFHRGDHHWGVKWVFVTIYNAFGCRHSCTRCCREDFRGVCEEREQKRAESVCRMEAILHQHRESGSLIHFGPVPNNGSHYYLVWRQSWCLFCMFAMFFCVPRSFAWQRRLPCQRANQQQALAGAKFGHQRPLVCHKVAQRRFNTRTL